MSRPYSNACFPFLEHSCLVSYHLHSVLHLLLHCLLYHELVGLVLICVTEQRLHFYYSHWKAGELILEYEDTNKVFITDIYPDDQPNYVQDIPTKKFRVTNKSSLYVMYNLRWVVTLNDYESENFKYKIASTGNGANFDFRTAPKTTTPVATEIIIPPYSSQEYEIDFKLQGVGGRQNYDQGKTFSGYIEIYLDNEY